MLEVVAAGEHTEFVALEAGSFGDSRVEAGRRAVVGESALGRTAGRGTD